MQTGFTRLVLIRGLGTLRPDKRKCVTPHGDTPMLPPSSSIHCPLWSDPLTNMACDEVIGLGRNQRGRVHTWTVIGIPLEPHICITARKSIRNKQRITAAPSRLQPSFVHRSRQRFRLSAFSLPRRLFALI